jgi:hypothetical protein
LYFVVVIGYHIDVPPRTPVLRLYIVLANNLKGVSTCLIQPVVRRLHRSKLSKKLPTFRVGFAKQLDALRAYAVLSDGGTKAVHYSKVGEIINVHEANVSSMNPFFLENGFIEKQGAGYVPTAPIVEYNRAFSWNPETAAQKLAPIVINSWFGQALRQRLQFRQLSEDDAIEVLAAVCKAEPAAKPQLRILLDYCEGAGILTRANGQLASAELNLKESKSPTPPSATIEQPLMAQSPERPQSPSPALASDSQDGAINLQIGVHVSLAEMKDWSPERITAFFGGIAQVLAAKNKSG